MRVWQESLIPEALHDLSPPSSCSGGVLCQLLRVLSCAISLSVCAQAEALQCLPGQDTKIIAGKTKPSLNPGEIQAMCLQTQSLSLLSASRGAAFSHVLCLNLLILHLSSSSSQFSMCFVSSLHFTAELGLSCPFSHKLLFPGLDLWFLINLPPILPSFPDRLLAGSSPAKLLAQAELLPQYFLVMPQLTTSSQSHSANKLISLYLDVVEVLHSVLPQRMFKQIWLRGKASRSARHIYR